MFHCEFTFCRVIACLIFQLSNSHRLPNKPNNARTFSQLRLHHTDVKMQSTEAAWLVLLVVNVLNVMMGTEGFITREEFQVCCAEARRIISSSRSLFERKVGPKMCPRLGVLQKCSISFTFEKNTVSFSKGKQKSPEYFTCFEAQKFFCMNQINLLSHTL